MKNFPSYRNEQGGVRNSARLGMIRSRLGMSMVELLVVIAILGMMMAVAVPALVGISQGQGMKRAVNEISELVESARLEAMATSTWVWLGIANTTENNQPEITIAVMASPDGTSSPTAAKRPLIRPLRIENVKIMNTLTPWATNSDIVPLTGSDHPQFTVNVAGKNRQFKDMILGFSPQGEVTVKSNAINPWIEIGVREMRGTTEITNKTASIRISGVSGQQVIDY